MSDTWCPRVGPRVLTPFASYRTRVTLGFDDHQPTKIFHVHCTVVRSVRSCHVRLYGLVQSASNFLHVWLGEQIVISSPYEVHLTK